MKDFLSTKHNDIKKIKYVLCDIDDTITHKGKLTDSAYTSLWKLKRAGYSVIPVTGRPAGWCDMIIRQWPVHAVIGENGAFVFYSENDQIKTFTHPSVASGDVHKKLESVKKACLSGVKGCRVSKDQFSRMYDLAIDFNEDPPYLGFEAAEKIRQICEEMGAVAKVSSIHVNTWFGNYNKVDMASLFFKQILKVANIKECCIFFGDSPNDEPMFEFLPLTCAVANIKPFLPTLQHLPAYITQKNSSDGFVSAINHLLKLKNKPD